MKSHICFLVYCTSSWLIFTTAKHYDHNDPRYVEKTGKTYDELVASGDYIPIEVFENFTEATWKDHSRVNTLASRTYVDAYEIKYWFYSENHWDGRKIIEKAAHIKSSGWKPERGLKVIIHGFKANAKKDVIVEIKDAYLSSKSPNNVLAVDWSKYSGFSLIDILGTFGYDDAAEFTEKVGDIVGDFIAFLLDEKLVKNAGSVHIIGHSLGAHLAGRAGRRLRQEHDKTLGRVTGLDPAGPSFYESVTSKRLDPTDAKFVDVIHTDAGDLDPFTTVDFGTKLKCGHVDFYPNGGSNQPGCDPSLKNLLGLLGTCEHSMSYHFFAKSVRTKNKYTGCTCTSWAKYKSGKCTDNNDKCKLSTAIMGEHCKPGTKGQYFLRTKRQMNQI